MDPSKENREGVDYQAVYGPLALNLDDAKITEIIGTRVSDSENFWNKTLQLEETREKNESIYLDTIDYPIDLYDYEMPYRNNRIFSAVETLIPLILSQQPEPVVTEANDTDASKELARGMKYVLLGLYDDLEIKYQLEMVARHLLIGMRLGVMKYRWDDMLGRKNENGERSGGIAVETIRPTRIVIEQKTPWNKANDVPLVGEYMSSTVEELCLKFPDKETEIIKEFGGNKLTPILSTSVGYIELWFSYYDKSTGEKNEALVWKYKNLLLDKMKNPNYNYDEYSKDDDGNLVYNNFFDRPQKPYVFFNHINLGRFLVDDTSLIEQAAPQQNILYKRGLQIIENADMANSGLIFNSNMVKEEDVAKLIGDPDEKIMASGNVLQAAARLPSTLLPEYVIRDKYDARQEVDNIYGTNAPLRGEQSGTKTLGQEIIAQRSNMSRVQTVADSLERGAGKVYRGITQLIKIFWDEPTMVKYTGRDGYSLHMEFSGDKVEDGVQIRVKAGSLLPHDEIAERNETIQAMNLLDPLSLAEGLGKKDPKEFAKRIIYYNFSMDKYLSDVLGLGMDSIDRDAINDISLINKGSDVPVREEPTREYLDTLANYLGSAIFQDLPEELKQRLIEFVKKTKDQVSVAIKLKSPEEGAAADSSTAGSPGAEPPISEPGAPAAVPGANPMDQPQPNPAMSNRLQVLQP